MATLQERRLGYHSRVGVEPGTSRFSTLRLNHYAARGISPRSSIYVTRAGWAVELTLQYAVLIFTVGNVSVDLAVPVPFETISNGKC